MMKKELANIYRKRFQEAGIKEKEGMWKVLTENFFQQFINPNKDTVVDIAAGYGEFVNNIIAKKKIAVDLNKDIKKFVNDDVECILADCKDISCIKDNSVNVVFISNFLEHLGSTDEVITVLKECYRILKKNGKIMILQPNIYYVKEKYWFFIDHKTPLTHVSLVEALNISGFKIDLLRKKFLPYSTKSRLPKNSWLVKAYLKMPLAQLIFGKQTFVIGVK